MPTYLALLRGINVGGKNLIKMADLRAAFEADGYVDVRTYIQSGNVILTSPERSASKLTTAIERMLTARFGYDASVTLRTRLQMRAILDGAPKGFGANPAKYRSDVIFLIPPLTARTAIADVPMREGVDLAWPGKGVLYFQRLTSRATQSRLSGIVSLPIYRSMTIRNWGTTTKLFALMDSSSGTA